MVQMNGFGLVLWCAMYSSIAATNSGTLVNTPRRSHSLVTSRKKRSTMFSYKAEVAVKCIVKRGCLSSRCGILGCSCVT